MNIIIDLIIKIFQAIFEEDRNEREKRRARIEALKARQRAARDGGPESMESFLQELFGDQAAPPPPKRQAPPPPPPRRKEPAQETYQEHLARLEARNHQQDQRARAMQQHVDQYLGKSQVEHRQNKHFQLPGKTPLEQAVIAGIIFGPCKAHQKSGIIKTL